MVLWVLSFEEDPWVDLWEDVKLTIIYHNFDVLKQHITSKRKGQKMSMRENDILIPMGKPYMAEGFNKHLHIISGAKVQD